MTTERLAFRFTQTDRANLAAITNGLRTAGDTYANMTDAVRHALTLAAAAAAAPVAAPNATS